MAGRNSRTLEDVRHDLEQEREQLATAAESLRESMNVTAALRSKLPLVAAGALGAGFFLAGGIGATARLLMRRSREGETKARVGRFRLVDRD
jgi:ornithine cyclodeaminase/alanine dehydrogenase-like protein (mu-crystallin family)